MFKSLEDVKSAHKGHWFDKETLAFFGSRISPKVYPTAAGAFFVSSERNGDEPRRYSVRFASLNGDISTVGEFQQWTTSAGAHGMARKLAS